MPFHLNLINKSCVQTPFNQHREGSAVFITELSSCLHTVCEAAGTETLESARITASHRKANMVLYQVERKSNHKKLHQYCDKQSLKEWIIVCCRYISNILLANMLQLNNSIKTVPLSDFLVTIL